MNDLVPRRWSSEGKGNGVRNMSLLVWLRLCRLIMELDDWIQGECKGGRTCFRLTGKRQALGSSGITAILVVRSTALSAGGNHVVFYRAIVRWSVKSLVCQDTVQLQQLDR